MRNFTKLLLLVSLSIFVSVLSAQTSCGQDEPFLLPPTSTFCADSAGFVVVKFKIYNNGDPGTYKVAFPDGSDTTYTNVVNTVEVSKKFLFDCGSPPGDPTPPSDGALYFEYASALTVTRTDCVDERGDNQKGTYDFRVVPNPIVDIKHSNLNCLEPPLKVNFEGKLCSDKLAEAYQWYIDGVLIEGATEKKYTGHVFPEPGTYVVRLEVTPHKGCEKYYYEKVILVTAKPKIELSYTVDTTTLCDTVVQVFPDLKATHATFYEWSSVDPEVSFSDPTIANPVITIRNEQAGIRTIQVIARNANCSSEPETFQIETQRGQNIQALDEIVTCTGYVLDLCTYLAYSPVPEIIRWTADRSGVNFSDNSDPCPFVTFSEVGDHLLTASGKDACGEAYSITVPVRVRNGSKLQIDLSEVDTLCTTDAPFNLLDYISPAEQVSTITGAAVTNNIFDPAVADGTSDVIVTDSCGYRYPLELFVISLETYRGRQPRLCEGDSVDLSAIQRGSYSGPGVTDNVFRSEGLAIGTYEIAFSSLTRCGGEDTLTVTVEEIPTAGFEIVTDSCATGPDGGIYAGLNPVRVVNRSAAATVSFKVLETGQQINDRDTTQFTFEAAGVYTIEQVVAFPGGPCADTSYQTLEVLMPPVIRFGYAIDSTVCDSLTIDFTAGPQPDEVTYRWAFTNTDRSTGANPRIELARPINAEVLGVDLSVMNACYTTADTFGVVLPLRFRVSFDVLNDNNTICSGDTAFLANTSVNGKDFLVTYPDGRQARALPPYVILHNETQQVRKYPIRLRGSNDNCPDQEAVDTIYVLPVETRAAFSLDYGPVCASAEVTLTNASTPGALCFVDWGDGSTPQFVDDLGKMVHTYSVSSDSTFTVTLSAERCGSDTYRKDITVRPAPDASFEITAVDANCKGEDLVFTSTADVAAYGLSWDFGDGTRSQQTAPVHAYRNAGTYRVFCTATSRNGCTAVDSFDLRVGDYNGADLTFQSTSTVCEGGNYGLELSKPLTGWFIDYGNGIVSEEPLERPYSQAGRYILQLSATSENGCKRDSSLTVDVYPAFRADITTAQRDTLVELGDEVKLRVNVSPPRNITEILWTGDSIADPTSPYTSALPFRDGIYSISLRDQHGCTATDSLGVRVTGNYAERIYAPNAFSPNGDGYNETFGIEANSTLVREIRYLRIMNRFGGIVYECTNCPTGSRGTGWDGTLGGQPLQGNVYIWAAEIEFIDGSSQLFTGDVTLLR